MISAKRSHEHLGVDDTWPVAEDYFTQIGRGPEEFGIAGLRFGDSALVFQNYAPLAVGGGVMKPGYLALLVPLRWRNDYFLDGQATTQNSAFIFSGQNGFFSRGEGREICTLVVRKRMIVGTLAALRGVDPDEIALPRGHVELPTANMERLRGALARLHAALNSDAATGTCRDAIDIGATFQDLIRLVFDNVLLTNVEERPPEAILGRSRQIVRAAERRFDAASWEPVSLADLCAAAGVGQTTLYRAFQHLYSESPIRYFHRRRLGEARRLLLHADQRRGAVTYAALCVGLTEFGRFSQEYKQLFGECPSVTLTHQQEKI